MTDDGQTTDSGLVGGASVNPGTDQLLEVANDETYERTREEWIKRKFEGDAKFSVFDLDVHCGDDRVLNGVSMEIPENSIAALVGPSGYGKSTLLRCFSRMNDRIKTTRIDGSVRLEGEKIYQEGISLVELCKRIGIVSQLPNPFSKNIADNVSYRPRKRGDLDTGLPANLLGRSDGDAADKLVERPLRQVALWDEVQSRLDNNALGLSGGQQQWFCITRALATDPEMLLMDGPASTLNPIATPKIEDLVHDLVEEYTIAIVTHNMQQVARISGQTAMFLTGDRLAEYGDTDQVFEDLQNQHVEDYTGGKFG